MIEHHVEEYLVKRCREVGFLCWKFTSPGHAGVPDRIVISPRGTAFVEVKRPGGRLRRLQREVIDKMRAAGAHVHVIETLAGVDGVIGWLAGKTADASPRNAASAHQCGHRAIRAAS